MRGGDVATHTDSKLRPETESVLLPEYKCESFCHLEQSLGRAEWDLEELDLFLAPCFICMC